MFLILTSLLVLSSAQAMDTSGCSPLLQETKQVERPNGSALSVSYERPNRADCWNTSASRIALQYEFPGSESTPVTFWISLNGRAQTLSAQAVRCGGLHMQPDFGLPVLGDGRCVARLFLATSPGAQRVEIAPFVNGQADTDGYGRNTVVTF